MRGSHSKISQDLGAFTSGTGRRLRKKKRTKTMNQYQADFSLNRTQRLEFFYFASSVSGTQNFD